MRDTIDMAREAGLNLNFRITGSNEALDRLVEYVRADEREACAKVIESHGPFLANGAMLAEAIRARGNT